MHIIQAFFRPRQAPSFSSVSIPIEPRDRFEATLRTSMMLRHRGRYLITWWTGMAAGALPAAIVGEVLFRRFDWNELSLDLYMVAVYAVAASSALLRWYDGRPLPGERITKAPLRRDETGQVVRDERFYIWPLLKCTAKSAMVCTIILSVPLVGWNVFYV